MNYKKLIFVMALFCISFLVNGQSKDISDVKIPLECLGGKIYLAKFDAISPFEANQLIEKNKIQENDELLSNIEAYNLIIFRKLNNFITDSYLKHQDSSFILLHSRDIAESDKNDLRFVIKSVTTRSDILNGRTFSYKFFIYDTKLNVNYAPFDSLDDLLSAFKKVNNFYKKTPANSLTQDKINKFIPKDIPKKEKKPKGQGKGSGVAIVFLLLAFFVGIPIATYLIS